MKLEEMTQARPGDHCVICGAHPAIIGIFTPSDPILWGAPQGKTRLVRYCLCERCKQKPDTPDNVEKIIKADLVGGAPHAE